MITKKQIETVRSKAKQTRALVIGDAMLDQYIYGVVERISPEAPVPILSHQRSEVKAGGAANVALNLAAWGCQTSLIAMTGNDGHAEVLKNILHQNNIEHSLFQTSGRSTTIKTRVVASSHHLLRIDEESITYLTGEEEIKAIKHITDSIKTFSPRLVVLQDYNKGFLTEEVIKSVLQLQKQMGFYVAVDPKEKNFLAYQGVDLFKPNLREAGQAAHRSLSLSDLSGVCNEWHSKLNAKTIAVTLGSQGIFLSLENEQVHIPPFHSIDVVDVCGAGDEVICSLALGMMAGLDLSATGNLANLTGGYVCSHSGVVAVNVDEIYPIE